MRPGRIRRAAACLHATGACREPHGLLHKRPGALTAGVAVQVGPRYGGDSVELGQPGAAGQRRHGHLREQHLRQWQYRGRQPRAECPADGRVRQLPWRQPLRRLGCFKARSARRTEAPCVASACVRSASGPGHRARSAHSLRPGCGAQVMSISDPNERDVCHTLELRIHECARARPAAVQSAQACPPRWTAAAVLLELPSSRALPACRCCGSARSCPHSTLPRPAAPTALASCGSPDCCLSLVLLSLACTECCPSVTGLPDPARTAQGPVLRNRPARALPVVLLQARALPPRLPRRAPALAVQLGCRAAGRPAPRRHAPGRRRPLAIWKQK